MNKKFLLFFSLLFVFVSLFNTLTFAENKAFYGPFEVNPRSIFDVQEELSALSERENAVFKTKFRDVIDDNSQVIYDYIVQNYENIKNGSNNIKFTLNSKTGYSYQNPTKLIEDMNYALGALDLDYMEFYWFNLSKLAYSYYEKNNGIELMFTFRSGYDNFLNDAYNSTEEVDNDIKQLNTVINDITSKVANKCRYDQILYFNDFLVKKNEYNRYVANGNSSSASSLAFEPVSSLIYGSTDWSNEKNPVCEGYARGLKMLCDKANIPCILVSGQNHMWNAIQMEDGAWYSMDSTFNDPVYNGSISESYFETIKNDYTLVGTNTVIRGTAFLDGHTPDGGFLVYGANYCTYPEFSTEAYKLDSTKMLLEKVLNDDFIISDSIAMEDLDGDGIFTVSDIVKKIITN